VFADSGPRARRKDLKRRRCLGRLREVRGAIAHAEEAGVDDRCHHMCGRVFKYVLRIGFSCLRLYSRGDRYAGRFSFEVIQDSFGLRDTLP
jgi:hypothetical protein